jgi:hypothetical protein
MRSSMVYTVCLMAVAATAHGFGGKKLNATEVTGVTETQLVKEATGEKLSVMLRGRGAELLFKTIQEKRAEKLGSDALEWIGNLNNSHWTVEGDQVTCSRIQNAKSKKEDYACAFELKPDGKVAAGLEPFTPAIFNLAKTKTQAKLFQKKAPGRGLASASAPVPHQAKAYVLYDDPKKKKESENAMFVFRGWAATEIMGFLTEGKEQREFIIAGAKGIKGREISCVKATNGEPDRCAIVVSLKDGSVSTSKNPLFR